MPSYQNTLLEQTCRAAVSRQIEYGRQRGVPWGISESCYNLTDMIQAWAPEEQLAVFERFAKQQRLALMISDPEAGDTPPTLLKNPEELASGEDIVHFYQTPGYFGWDPSVAVFFSFALFFAMAKAELLYQTIDQSSLYRNPVDSSCRSRMNVPFILADQNLDKPFLAAAEANGLFELKGHRSVGGMELPTYHMPTLSGVFIRTWDRLKSFLFNAGKVIVPMVLVLNFLNAWGTDGSFGQENSNKSVLSEIGRSLTPAFKPMGIDNDNWPATVGIFTGVLAKEAVVGTLDALYSQLGETESAAFDTEAFDLKEALIKACLTVPENLRAVADNLLDPLGLNIGPVNDLDSAANEQEVNTGTFAAMMMSAFFQSALVDLTIVTPTSL